MKIAHLFAAALMVAGIGVSAEASAQRYDGGYNQDIRYDRGDRHDRYDRRDGRRYDRHDNRRWDRRDRRNWRGNRGRNNCRIVYRHHQRYTVCR
jgi:hypothetical protein